MLLELLNSLLASFVATEVSFAKDVSSGLRHSSHAISALACLNAIVFIGGYILEHLSFEQSRSLPGSERGHGLGVGSLIQALSGAWHGFRGTCHETTEQIGSEVFLATSLTIILSFGVYGSSLRDRIHGYLVNRKSRQLSWLRCSSLLAGLWLVIYTALHSVHVGEKLSHTHAAKFTILMFTFIGLCYADIHRSRPDVDIHDFALQTGKAVLKTLAVFPCVALLVATLSMVLVEIVESLGLDPHFLNWPVYYAVLHGPFLTLYWFVKQHYVRSRFTFLPI